MTEPVSDGPPSTFLDSLGARGTRRAEPRASIAIAGAGCVLGVLGVLIVSGDTGSGDGGDFNQLPGIILSGLVVAAGFFLLAALRDGPIATAGTVAASLGVPALMFFITVDENSFPPYSTEGILVVSTIVWLASYLVGPGRGRPFFLGIGLFGLWASALQVTEKVFDSPFLLFGVLGTASFESTGSAIDSSSGEVLDTGGFDSGFSEPSFHVPSATNIGMLSLLFGVAFLLAARTLDKRGRHGTATPFAVAAIPTLIVGAIALIDDLESEGTGLLLLAIGLALAMNGTSTWRRATTWIGGALTAIGAAAFLADMTDDATTGGMLFLAAGIALVAGAHALGVATSEPDEMALTMGGSPDGEPPTPRRVLSADAAPPDDPGQWAPPTPE